MSKENVKSHFEKEALEFDRIILTLIPHYATIVRMLVEAIPFERSAPLRVIDLGCGTGTLAAKVLESFPNAHITCVDMAENMIALAQAKLKLFPRVNYVVADLYAFDFDARYDAAISSLALHHLTTDEDKREFYWRVYESLNTGGVFYNADVVLASCEFLQGRYMDGWRQFMRRSISAEEIEGKWIARYYQEDHPARLTDQMSWLKEIGFADVDVLWKYYNFAVYGGIRL